VEPLMASPEYCVECAIQACNDALEAKIAKVTAAALAANPDFADRAAMGLVTGEGRRQDGRKTITLSDEVEP
jgi:hypothetical protein